MKSIKIGNKPFKLGSRAARLFALFIDAVFLTGILAGIALFLEIVDSTAFRMLALSALLWTTARKIHLPTKVSVIAQLLLIGILGPWSHQTSDILIWFAIILGGSGLLFMDGFGKGHGFGKKIMSLKVLRLKDGKPCTLKDAFIRRVTTLLQPLDLLWTFGKNRQRMGDKLADTIVVKLETETAQGDAPEREPEIEAAEPEDPEKVLDDALLEMKNRFAEAQEKVDASIGVEKLFQDAYEGAVAQAERWEERAIISINAGREDLAREDLEKRNEYRRLADQYKKQWEEQQETVQSLTNLLEHFQQKITEATGKKAAVIAQHRNVDAEAHLREMLTEIQDSTAFDSLTKMEREAAEAATLTKAAAAVDTVYQDTKTENEFARYAEEASIEKDLAELKKTAVRK